MVMRCAVAMVLCVISAAGSPVALGEDAPAKAGVFRDLSPKEARDLANDEGKILLVRWTATWCGPCKRMDATTWPHPDVVRWVGEHAVAISADLDAQRRGAEIQKVNAVPTVIAFRDGKELDRTVGYQTAEELVPWLESLRDGKTIDERLTAEIAGLPTNGGREEVDARYDLARRLARAGHPEEATEQYLWLWENMVEQAQGMSGVRVSFMAGDMESVALVCPACREKFVALRDALASRITPGPEFDFEALNDWMVLNCRVLNEGDAVVRWAEAWPQHGAGESTSLYNFLPLRSELVERNRWDLAAKFIDDPVREAREHIEHARSFMESTDERLVELRADVEFVAMQASRHRTMLGEYHALALVQGKESEAAVIMTEAIAFDGSDEMRVAVVRAALRAGCAREVHRGLLAGCKVPNPMTSMQLDAALARPATE